MLALPPLFFFCFFFLPPSLRDQLFLPVLWQITVTLLYNNFLPLLAPLLKNTEKRAELVGSNFFLLLLLPPLSFPFGLKPEQLLYGEEKGHVKKNTKKKQRVCYRGTILISFLLSKLLARGVEEGERGLAETMGGKKKEKDFKRTRGGRGAEERLETEDLLDSRAQSGQPCLGGTRPH